LTAELAKDASAVPVIPKAAQQRLPPAVPAQYPARAPAPAAPTPGAAKNFQFLV